nr:MAG TPA: hypothetical protein [Caudoviricetes sp.]
MKVKNLLDHRNQFIIYDDEGNVGFQSYNTYMAKVCYPSGNEYIQLNMKSNYWSATTGRHMAEFLRETRLMNAVNTLIENKVFKNLKDFMQNTDVMQVSRFSIYIEYTDKDGNLTNYKYRLVA